MPKLTIHDARLNCSGDRLQMYRGVSCGRIHAADSIGWIWKICDMRKIEKIRKIEKSHTTIIKIQQKSTKMIKHVRLKELQQHIEQHVYASLADKIMLITVLDVKHVGLEPLLQPHLPQSSMGVGTRKCVKLVSKNI